MNPALIKLTQTIFVHKSIDKGPFFRIFNDTYKTLRDNLNYSGYKSWEEVKANKNETKELNSMLTEQTLRIISRFHLHELNLDERLFRTLPNSDRVKVEVINMNILSDEDYQIAVYLLSDILTLVDNDGRLLLLAIDDKSENLKNSQEFEIFSLTQNKDYRIEKYKSISNN